MATRRAGRGCGAGSSTAQRAPRGPSASGEAASPPVLSLSHFCTKPFLCFGDVRVGASRTLPLALDNPNAEEASVTLPRFPAAARGFDVRPRAFVLQVGDGGAPGRAPSPRPSRERHAPTRAPWRTGSSFRSLRASPGPPSTEGACALAAGPRACASVLAGPAGLRGPWRFCSNKRHFHKSIRRHENEFSVVFMTAGSTLVRAAYLFFIVSYHSS